MTFQQVREDACQLRQGYLLTLALLVLLTSHPVASSFVTWNRNVQQPVSSSYFRNHAMILQSTASSLSSTDSLPNEQTDSSEQPPSPAAATGIISPGILEDDKFHCENSVSFWRNFQNPQKDSSSSSPTSYTWQDNAQQMTNIANRFLSSQDPAQVQYFFTHVARSGYFVTNAILGNAGFQLHEQLLRRDATSSNNSPSSSALPLNLSSDVASRIVLEALLCYEQDYESISKGQYREPWDMKLGHRQSSPINVVTQTGRFVQEAIGTLVRRNRREETDKLVKFFEPEAPSLYPEYYRNAFHWQTDGWMSQDSANVYETSTETLFLGRQDAMQRISIPPILEHAKKIQNTMDRPLRVLEIACGTGRFMTFVRDNLPLDAEYTAVDLSPFYLEKARDNDDYWRKTRGAEEEAKGTISPAKLIQANAESLPFDDNSFDVVLCVYLFHELPRDARARVAQEMSRVANGGGKVVFTDSMQRGDRPPLDNALSNFEKMNEPYYVDYIMDDLPMHFEKAGLVPLSKAARSSTKMLSFGKKEEEEEEQM